MYAFWVVVGAVLLVAALYGAHRLLVAAEDRGWIHYRTKGKSGAASMASLELMAIFKPDIEHVIEQTYTDRAVRAVDEQAGPGAVEDDEDPA